MLASHSQVHGAGEFRLTRNTLESIPNVLGRSDRPLECLPLVDAAVIQHLAQQHETELLKIQYFQKRSGIRTNSVTAPGILANSATKPSNLGTTEIGGCPAERIVDKMPDNYTHLGLLAVLFPRATFIHCTRNLRDVAVSCWMTDFRSIRWANDPQHIATRFQQYHRLMKHWKKTLPVPIHEVNYEETVAGLEAVARRLLEACGLDWEPACLRFHETQRPVRTASVTQVRQPIYKQSVARWKNYETTLAPLFAALPHTTDNCAAKAKGSERRGLPPPCGPRVNSAACCACLIDCAAVSSERLPCC